ncbi:MAG TPA: recombinase family protein [Fimbriiglobus sp.]|nr:recombinase family protein [Fimbriiglobus sp.]
MPAPAGKPPRKTPPAIAYSYLRYSSPAQSDGDSVRRQTALRDSWLSRNPHVRLDSALKMEDRGVSGFRGEHRTNRKHALSQFMDEVERGRVPGGSYLIVENLDRLTREDPETSIPLVLNLIRSGVRIVQLVPAEMVYEPGMDFGRLMMMLWELARGHGESKRKSGLVGAAWGEKKRAARERHVPHGKAVPAWLELSDGEYRIRPEVGRTVRAIYRMAADGMGNIAIAQRLAAEGVAPVGRTGVWNKGYVNRLLTSRSVLGEYQPMTGPRGRRVPDGDAIEGYFPRLIDDALWAKVQATRGRRSHPGSRRPRSRHTLAGLVVDARTSSPMYVHKHQRVGPVFVSRDAYERRPGAPWETFPVGVLTDEILKWLAELRADELFDDPGAAKVSELTAKLADVELRLAKAREGYDADPENQTWSHMIDRYDRGRRKLVADLTAARAEAANPLSASWAEAVELMRQKEPERLRAALNRTVEEIRVLIVGRPMGKLAAAQVRFRGGGQRDYLVCRYYRHRSVPKEQHVPVRSWSFADAGAGPLDLRDPAEVAELEKFLAAADVDELERHLDGETGKPVKRAK